MAAQGERVPGVVVMCSLVVEPMVQDTPVQDIPEQDESLPQTNSEPEMGAAAAAEYDTSPSLLRNPPPIPAETAHPNAPDMAQLFAMLAGISGDIHGIKTDAKELKEEIKTTWKQICKQCGVRCSVWGWISRKAKGHCGVRCGKWANVCRRAKWRRHVLGRASWGECNGCQARGGGG